MNDNLLQTIIANFKLGLDSIHGLTHWRRVEKLGLMLAEKTGADRHVISLFAFLHDSQRVNELMDSQHGRRAAEWIETLFKDGELGCSEMQLGQLIDACRYHNDPIAKSEDITVQTCWDADRLDLWRVGQIPDPSFLCTEAARDPSMIQFSRKTSEIL
jgi:uncharacterized protein